MNPVLVKALIISGGTLGISVPSLYYAYPHISKLISPTPEESQKSSEKIRLTEGETSSRPSNTPNDGNTITNTQETGNLTNNLGDNATSTIPQNQGSNPQNPSSPGNGRESNSHQASGNENSGGGSGITSSPKAPTQSSTGTNNDSQTRQS